MQDVNLARQPDVTGSSMSHFELCLVSTQCHHPLQGSSNDLILRGQAPATPEAVPFSLHLYTLTLSRLY